MPKCIIFNPTYDHNKAFAPHKYFFNFNKVSLERKGYEIIEYTVNKESDIILILETIPKKSISLLWIRGHGEPTSIQFGEEYKLNSSEVSKVFQLLPSKLKDDACVLLNSCSTGKFDNQFYDNIQFAFGKLTQSMVDVRVIAPLVDAMSNLVIYTNDTNALTFYVSAANQDLGDINVMSVIGKGTKKLLNDSDVKMNAVQISLQADLESSPVSKTQLVEMSLIKKGAVPTKYEEKYVTLKGIFRYAIEQENIQLVRAVSNYLTSKDLIEGTRKAILDKEYISESIISLCLKKIMTESYKGSSFLISELPTALLEAMKSQLPQGLEYYKAINEIFTNYYDDICRGEIGFCSTALKLIDTDILGEGMD